MAAADAPTDQPTLGTEWTPHPGQRIVMDSPARYRIVAAGRRWGKSEMAAHAALEFALENPGSVVWWVAPSYQQANEFGFDIIEDLLSDEILESEPKRSVPRKIHLTNGSVLSFRSADREDALRGGGIDLLVIDEAGSVPDRAWSKELRPALSDTEGDLLAIGTPRGKNWYHSLFEKGQSSSYAHVASWRAPTSQNPHVPGEEIEVAREELPDRVYRAEYLAEFGNASAAVFRDLENASAAVFRDLENATEGYPLPVAPADATAPFALGVDLARHQDWTAIAVLDATGRLVAFDRLREISWNRIQQTIERFATDYAPSTVTVDATRDNKIVSDLEDGGLSVEPVSFTASNKRTMFDNLGTALESGDITLSADADALLSELEVFEYDITERGTVRYTAPAGHHDDAVDALALANHANDNRPTRTETVRRSGRDTEGRRVVRRSGRSGTRSSTPEPPGWDPENVDLETDTVSGNRARVVEAYDALRDAGLEAAAEQLRQIEPDDRLMAARDLESKYLDGGGR